MAILFGMDEPQDFDFRSFHALYRVAMIVACSENGVIGVDGDLPWHLPVDLKHFMRSTKGCSVIMGRKTFESLDRPLPNRLNIVLSRSMSDEGGKRSDGVRVASSIEDAIAIGEVSGMESPIWIAGGGDVYRQALDRAGLVDLIVRTRVHAQVAGDTVFPELDDRRWDRVRCEDFQADEKHTHSMRIEWWVRRSVED